MHTYLSSSNIPCTLASQAGNGFCKVLSTCKQLIQARGGPMLKKAVIKMNAQVVRYSTVLDFPKRNRTYGEALYYQQEQKCFMFCGFARVSASFPGLSAGARAREPSAQREMSMSARPNLLRMSQIDNLQSVLDYHETSLFVMLWTSTKMKLATQP